MLYFHFQTNVGALIISLNLVFASHEKHQFSLFVVRVLLTPEEAAAAAALRRAAPLQPLEGAAGRAVRLLQVH